MLTIVHNRTTHFHFFEPSPKLSDSTIPNPPGTICSIHPKADPTIKNLTHAQLELIYHETHGHGGCFKAIGMYEFFFDLFPDGQNISIQIADEVFKTFLLFQILEIFAQCLC